MTSTTTTGAMPPAPATSVSLRSRLYAELARRDIDIKEAARIMDIPASSVGRWLGGVSVPMVKQVPQVAKFLHLEPEVLMPAGTTPVKLNAKQEAERQLVRVERLGDQVDRLEAVLKEAADLVQHLEELIARGGRRVPPLVESR